MRVKNFDINRRITQIIEYLSISNNKFADSIGISSSRISNIVTNRNNPDSQLLAAILDKYTNVSAEWLVTGRGKMTKDYINDDKKTESIINEDTCKYTCVSCKEKERVISSLNKLISAQEKIISQLEYNLEMCDCPPGKQKVS